MIETIRLTWWRRAADASCCGCGLWGSTIHPGSIAWHQSMGEPFLWPPHRQMGTELVFLRAV